MTWQEWGGRIVVTRVIRVVSTSASTDDWAVAKKVRRGCGREITNRTTTTRARIGCCEHICKRTA